MLMTQMFTVVISVKLYLQRSKLSNSIGWLATPLSSARRAGRALGDMRMKDELLLSLFYLSIISMLQHNNAYVVDEYKFQYSGAAMCKP